MIYLEITFSEADVVVMSSMLEAIGAGVTPRVGPTDWKDVWLDSSECARVKEEIKALKSAALSRPSETNSELTKTCASSFPEL